MLNRKGQKQTLKNLLFQKKNNPFLFSRLVNSKVQNTSYYVREGTFNQERKFSYPFSLSRGQGRINVFANFDGLSKNNTSLDSFLFFSPSLSFHQLLQPFSSFSNAFLLPTSGKESTFGERIGSALRKKKKLFWDLHFSRYPKKKILWSKGNQGQRKISGQEVNLSKPTRVVKTPYHGKPSYDDRSKERYLSKSFFNSNKKKLFRNKEKMHPIDSDFNSSSFLSPNPLFLPLLLPVLPVLPVRRKDRKDRKDKEGSKVEEFDTSNPKKSRFFKERNAYLIPDFVEIQRKSFFQLLENGLIEEFAKRNPITNKNLEIFFYPEYYQLTPPEYNPRRAILISKSYSSKLFVPAQLTDKKLKKSQLKWVLIGNLPLMTKRGHFVLNGAPRVIVNQILRSPGIYFQGSLKEIFSDQWSEKPEKTYKRFYTDLICLRGTWLRIEIDKNKDIWAQMKKVPKIPLLWFLLAMGLTERIIFKSVLNPTRLLANFNLTIKRKIDYEYVTNASDAWKAISTLLSSSNKESSSYNASPSSLIIPTSSASFDSDSNFDSDSDSNGTSNFDSGSDSLIENNGLPNPKMEVIKSILPSSSEATEQTNQNPNLKSVKKREKELLSLQKQSKVFSDLQIERSKDKDKPSNLILENNEPSLLRIGTKSLVQIKESEEKKIGTERKLVSFFNIVEHSKEGRNWIFKRFMNPRAYDLGTQGRLNFNRKLGLSISSNQTTLTAQDVLFATDYLFKVEKGLKNIDDIDHLKNRRVRTSGELLQIQIGIGLVRLEKIIREKLTKINAQTRASDFLTNRPNPLKVQVFKLESLPFRASSKKKLLLTQNKKGKKKLPSSLLPLASLLSPYQGKRSIGVASFPLASLPKVGKHRGSSRTKGFATSCEAPQVKGKQVVGKQKLSNNQKNKISGGKNGYGGTVGEEFKMNNLINTKAFNGALREFFGSSQLSQFMDQLNPLAEITHKRRLSSMGPGGVTRDSATLAIRGIHPTHYGRICPIETPEGKNTGLVNSLTTYSRASSQGFLESPFYKVYKGQVQKKAGMFFLSAEQEENIKVAAADVSTTSGRVGFLPKNKIPAKIAYGDTISKISRSIVEYIGVSPIQMISIATSLIPFVEHDDANRALMGSNMQRQAVPLVRAERPLVGTGLESRTVSDSGHAVIAKESGYVAYVSGKKMVIYTIPNNY